MSICLFFGLSNIYLDCPSVHLCVYLVLSLSVRLSTHVSIYLDCLSVHLTVCLSLQTVGLLNSSVYVYVVCLSIHLTRLLLKYFYIIFRWYFSVIGEPHTSCSFLLNAWLMVISFFLCRIVVIPYYYYKCFIVWDTPERQLLGFMPQLIWIFTSCVLDVLNVFWMFKMVRGGVKILMSNRKKQE